MAFAHLHVHSTASPLDGMIRPAALHDAMRADGQSVAAVTDHGSLGAIWAMSVEFDKLNSQYDTKLRLAPGLEAYAAIGSRFDPGRLEVPAELDNDGDGDSAGAVKIKTYQHLTINAYNTAGYRNLLKIFRAAQDSFYKHPLIDFELLAAHSEGLNIGSGCLGGVVAEYLKIGDVASAETNLSTLYDIFGPEHLFVEVMDHGLAIERRVVVPELVRLAGKFGLPLVATNDSHYACADDAEAHEVMLAVGTHGQYGADSTFRFTGSGYHLRTESEMRAVSKVDWWQEAVTNSQTFADMVEPSIVTDTVGPGLKLPEYVASDGVDAHTEFIRRTKAGAVTRYGRPGDRFSDLRPDVQDRTKLEHQVIHDFGVESYMLIEADACDAIRAAGIPLGAGRGSGAGSISAYNLGVTQVEPLASDLLFERFLNLSRKGLPDVDTDVPSSRQLEAMQVIAEMFGTDRVVRVGRRTVKQAKAALKAVATALGQQRLGFELADLVPAKVADGSDITLSALLDEPSLGAGVPAEVVAAAKVTYLAGGPLRDLQQSSDDAERIIRFARAIEGNPMSWTAHAGGLVVADRPVHETAPVFLDRSGGMFPVMEADMKEAEAMGFVKYDFLPIADLDVVSRTVELIEQTTGERVDLNSLHADSNDDRSLAAKRMIAEGRTAGVFQLSSRGMTELAMSARPDCLDDFSALLALYRPGPMGGGMHTEFAARRRGGSPVDYGIYGCNADEAAVFEPILASTYGLICYQEQMQLLAQAVAGFDGGQMGKLQKAISKKIAKDMADLHKVWLDGGMAGRGASGVVFSRECLEQTWAVFQAAGAYAFNKSHSAAYAYLTWWTAFLKANFPTEFSAALLEFTTREDKRIEVARDMRDDGTTFLPPSVNLAAAHTSIVVTDDGPAVMFGLSEVKGVKGAAEMIVEARTVGGPFVSVADFKRRSGVNAAVFKNLVDAGSLDEFGPRLGVATLLLVADRDVPVPNIEWGVLERDFRQRRVLGVSLGDHPIRSLAPQISEWVAGRPIVPPERVPSDDKVPVFVLGLIAAAEERQIRTGTMLTFMLESAHGSVECKLWPDRWARVAEAVGGAAGMVGRVGFVSGRTSVFTPVRDDESVDAQPAAPMISVSGSEILLLSLDDPGTSLALVDGSVVVPDQDVMAAAWLDDPQDGGDGPVEAAVYHHDVKVGQSLAEGARVSPAVLAALFGTEQVDDAIEWLDSARPGDRFGLRSGPDTVWLYAVEDRRVQTDLRKTQVMARLSVRASR